MVFDATTRLRRAVMTDDVGQRTSVGVAHAEGLVAFAEAGTRRALATAD